MNARPNTNSPNVLLLVEQHVAANLAEADEEISSCEKRLRDLIAKRETLRAIARAAGADVAAPTELKAELKAEIQLAG